MKKVIKLVIIKIIKIYQYLISPLLGQNCRFYPTCSSYAIQAINKHGILKGGYFALKRILRCNPYGGQGIDEIPDK